MAINLNTANIEELIKMPGIGEETAGEIISYRKKKGKFNSWDDVKKVPGFGNAMIKNLKSAGAEIGEETKDITKNAKEETKDRAKEMAEEVKVIAGRTKEAAREYTEEDIGVGRDFTRQVMNSYLTSFKLGLSLFETNMKMINQYFGQWMSLQQEMYSSLEKMASPNELNPAKDLIERAFALQRHFFENVK